MKSERAGRAGLVLAGLALCVGLSDAAQLNAKHMSIERTPEGDATVFRDSVVINDGDTHITANLARMYEGKGLALISDAVHITNPDAQVWADSARYHFSDKLAELFGNVRVRQESLNIRAPKLLYRSKEKSVRADSGVALENLSRSFRLTGRKGTYDMDSDVGVVDSSPVLTWRRESREEGFGPGYEPADALVREGITSIGPGRRAAEVGRYRAGVRHGQLPLRAGFGHGAGRAAGARQCKPGER